MARILSVSYDHTLLMTRQMLLEQMGHSVVSAEGFAQAFKICKEDGSFDLVILGHSIPHDDKAAIIAEVRRLCHCPVLALLRPQEEHVKAADRSIDSWEPRAFVEAVRQMFQPVGVDQDFA